MSEHDSGGGGGVYYFGTGSITKYYQGGTMGYEGSSADVVIVDVEVYEKKTAELVFAERMRFGIDYDINMDIEFYAMTNAEVGAEDRDKYHLSTTTVARWNFPKENK